MHELMHASMCLITGVEIVGFKLGINESHVEHKNTNTFNIFLISLAPFFLGNTISILLLYLMTKSFSGDPIIFLIINWLIISTIFYSIPSKQDTSNIKNSLNKLLKDLWKLNFIKKIISIIFWIIFYIPLIILIAIFDIFDDFEAARVFLIILIYGLILAI